MRTTMVLMAVVATGCVASDEHATTQAVAAPAVSVVERAPGELAVSWSADPLAVRYGVFEGGALVASVFDSSGGAPATSWIATGVDAGEHCYAVRTVYADGSTSDLSAAACAGSAGPVATDQVIEYSAALASPLTGAAMRFATNPSTWDIGDTSAILTCPITLPVGATITGVREHVRKVSGAASAIDVLLMDLDLSTGAVLTTFLGENATTRPGLVDVGASGLSVTVRAGHLYEARISEATTAPGAGFDFVYGWQVTAH